MDNYRARINVRKASAYRRAVWDFQRRAGVAVLALLGVLGVILILAWRAM